MFRSLLAVAGSTLVVVQFSTVRVWGDITVDPDNVGATDVLRKIGGKFVPLMNPVPDPLNGPGLLAIGETADGQLSVTKGGQIRDFAGRIGGRETGAGVASIDGPGSSWTTGQLLVGFYGKAELHITGGGRVVADRWILAVRESANAVVMIDGPGSSLMPTRYNQVNFGRGSVTLNLRNDGEFHYTSGLPHWSNLPPLDLDANDTIHLDGGVLDMHFGDLYARDGQFVFTGGVLRHFRQFRGDLHQQGGRIEIFSWPNLPQFDPTIGGDYTIDPNGTLEIDALANLQVSWTAMLSGTLNVYWPDKIYLPLSHDGLIEINPEIGDTFTVLTAGDDTNGGVVGQFDQVVLPDIAGNRLVTWAVQYNPNDVTLEVLTSFLTADFDQDGVVDDRDFLTWQAGYGTQYTIVHENGDADLDGDIDGDDFLIWQAQFGMTTGGGGAGSAVTAVAAVPEPAAGTLVLLIAAISFPLAASQSQIGRGGRLAGGWSRSSVPDW